MINFVATLLFALTLPCFAGTVGSGNTSNLASLGAENIAAATTGVLCSTANTGVDTGCQALLCGVGSSYSAGNYISCFKNNTQYQVPSGKVFYVLGMHFFMGSATGVDWLGVGYATATFTNNTASASPPTGAVDYGAAKDAFAYVNHPQTEWRFFPHGGFSFPALSYPFARTGTASGGVFYLIYYGIEK